MKITKKIQIGDYSFELTLESKSVHAHSLMIDYKLDDAMEDIKDKLITGTSEQGHFDLTELVAKHKEEKKL